MLHLLDCDLIHTCSGHDFNKHLHLQLLSTSLILFLNFKWFPFSTHENILNVISNAKLWYSSLVSYNKIWNVMCRVAIEMAKTLCGYGCERMPTYMSIILNSFGSIWNSILIEFIYLVYHAILFVVKGFLAFIAYDILQRLIS